ncbi:MAG: penicillin-binding protein 2 [Chlorobi bacterium]|nr:penicillin-binding protein 2 [Chlorobiota bacterium]
MATLRSLDDNINFGSKQRYNILKTIIFLVVIVFLSRLAYLQIIKGSDYLRVSEMQAIKPIIVEPFRGNMFDRNGNLLVHNEPSFTVTITRNDFRPESIPLLTSILEIDSAAFAKAFKPLYMVSKFVPMKVFKDVSFAKIAIIEEYNEMLPGVDITVESKRLYESKAKMAHILGYSREISKEQMKMKRYNYYRPGDVLGKTGLERSYEDLLRGNKGIEYVAVNMIGQKVASFEKGKSDISASHGFDLFLTLDKDLQEYVEKILRNKIGSVVAIDPNNGEIIAMASKPDYNLRDFTGKISAKIFNKLNNDPAKPFYHRSIMSAYPPGSTWKMLVALAALQEGVIDEKTYIKCGGFLDFGWTRMKCHGAHGNIRVRKAIQTSCNVFFYNLGMDLGVDKLEKYSRMFGFGGRSNVDLPSENPGTIPTRDWAKRNFGKSNVPLGHLANWGIGQGTITTTPLQMASYCATLANKGTYYQPHIVSDIHNNVTDKIEPIQFASYKLPIDKKYFDVIHNGMYDVVNRAGGTATNVRVRSGIKVCGKTGTAQNPHGRDHSWFICFAPKDDPQIALAVIIENAGFGNVVAGPIARNVLTKFFFPNEPVYISPPASTVTPVTSPEVISF